MSTLGNRLRNLRKKKGLSQLEVSKKFNLSESTIGMYERDERKPALELIKKFADFYEVSTDYLIAGEKSRNSEWDSKLPELTPKDERDIAKDLERMINSLESKDGYAQFDGQTLEDMDDEDRELLIASLENSLRLAKRIAKQKFTPKKYRK